MKPLQAPFRLVAIAGIMLSAACGSASPQVAVLPVEQPNTLFSSQAIATIDLAQNSPESLNSQGASNKENSNPLGTVLFWVGSVAVIAGIAAFYLKGSVEIGEDEVGIVVKKFNFNPFRPNLPTHQSIALNDEPGIQVDTLSMGKYWRYPRWMYTILKEAKICVPAEEIALVVAKYGASIPPERRLGRIVECDNFQDARKFLSGGGEKGQQLDILPTGEYRINTRLFTIITTANADQHNVDPRNLQICKIPSDMIGIVATMDGAPIEADKGEIAGSPISGHDNFQSPQKFILGGGRRGLQEEVLPSGSWKLNPWFIKIEKVPLTEVPEGTVGVVVSLIGKEAPKSDIDNTHTRSNPIEKGYELVEEGYRGVLKEPLSIGKHPINIKVKRVVIVPTHQITLDWSNDKTKTDDNYDKKLGVLKPVSVDGFVLDIVVRQSFRVPKGKAPVMISHIGSPGDSEPEIVVGNSSSSSTRKFKPIRDLIIRVLGPTVENYFYSAVQDRKALAFHQDRQQQQRAAADRLKAVLSDYGVEAIDTLISEIDLPDSLQKLLNSSTIEKLKAELIKVQQDTEEEIRKLTYLKAITAIQADLAQFQQGVQIEELKAKARQYQILAEAKSIEEQGKAQAKVQAELMQAIIDVIGRDGYVDIEKLKQLANFKFPSVLVNNSGGSNSGLPDVFMASMLENIASGNSGAITGSSQLLEARAIEAIESRIVCATCETRNLSNYKFCSNCGASLTSSSNLERSENG